MKTFADCYVKKIHFSNRVILLGLIVLLCFMDKASSGETQIQLDKNWKIKTGDNPAWSKADFDDAAWNKIRIGAK